MISRETKTIILLAMGSLAMASNRAFAQAEKQLATKQPASKQPAARRRAPNPAFAKVVDDPKLPRVLLIGDSISIGYTLPVREMLQGKANVHRIPANGGPTTRGLASIDDWLGEGNWDVIHFNWGLHDLKYVNEKGALTDVDGGMPQVPIAEYEANLRKLVARLQKTDAKLVWRSTTPVPEGARGRTFGDAARYNDVAATIMEEAGIPIDDQYAFCLPRLEKLQLPANVHFTPEGSRELAKQTVAAIERALADVKPAAEKSQE